MQDITVYKLQQKADGHVHIIMYMTGVLYQLRQPCLRGKGAKPSPEVALGGWEGSSWTSIDDSWLP